MSRNGNAPGLSRRTRQQSHSGTVDGSYCTAESTAVQPAEAVSKAHQPPNLTQRDHSPRPQSVGARINAASIPQELKLLPHWIVWREEHREGRITKVPYKPGTQRRASTTDPTSWGSFEDARHACQELDGPGGVGFVFTDTPYAGIDLDHCIDANGQLDKEESEIVEILDSYTELSPGGDGLHIIVRADLPPGRRRKGNIEMYDSGRYFTVTGNHYPGAPTCINDRQAVLRLLHQDLFAAKTTENHQPRGPRGLENLDDRDLVQRARTAKNGALFEQLWNGDWYGYPSQSEADLALCSILAFWTRGDRSQMDRLFRRSGLMRDKWERADYRENTITRALEGSTEFYDPGSGRHVKGVDSQSHIGETSRLQDSDVIDDPQQLLDQADALVDDPIEQAKVLERFAAAIADLAPVVQDVWIDAANKRGLANKTTLRTQIEQLQAGGPARPTDAQLRDRWIDQHPNTQWGMGDWRRCQQGYWPPVPREEIRREMSRVIEAEQTHGARLTKHRLDSVEELARVELFIPTGSWDSSPNLLVCENGTLNLDTLELEEHQEKHYITAAVPYEYDPSADCPNLKKVLHSTMGEAAAFLQEFAGYCLTPDTTLETAIWLQGLPGGGKSTLIGGIQAMLGERCGALGIANIEQSRFGLTGIIGKTLLVATEQPSGYIMKTNILNSLISGEPIIVEKKFMDPIEVVPRCKLLWSMNSLPRVKGGDNGIFRRVRVVPVSQVPEDERDPQLRERVREEGPGILNWALTGLRRLRERGHFEIPECVEGATNEFKMLSDKPALFLEAECVRDSTARVQSSILYLRYKEWCINNGYQPQGSGTMRAEWERLGLVHRRKSDARYYYGVRLKKPAGVP